MFENLEQRRLYFADSLKDLLADQSALEGYRYYQRDALTGEYRSLVERKRTRTYLQLPTKAGKTEIMLAMVLGLYRNAEPNTMRMFIVEPTKRLLHQTHERLLKRFPGIPAGLYYSDEHELKHPLTIITWPSFYDLLEKGAIKPQEVDYLFLDEAHRGLSDLRRDLLRSLYDTTVITGFTATSRFNELKALYRTLGEEAYNIDYPRLISEGFVSPRANVIVGMKVPKGTSLSEQRRAYCHAVKDVILGYRDSLEDDETVAGHQNIIANWTVRESRYMADILNNDTEVQEFYVGATGNPDVVPAAVIHGEMTDKQLNRIFADYDAGKIMNLTGSRIPLEGIDTTARNVFTPERWSELDTLQFGGRVRDPNLCRIFTFCLEGSNHRKPVLYAEAIGAARITREGVDRGWGVSLDSLQLSHPKIADNLTIYNTPDEVASYIKAQQPQPQNKATHYLGVAAMAERVVAWQPELQYIYRLLEAQHRNLPPEENFCQIDGISVPREFLTPIKDKHFAIRASAAEIIQDIVGEYPERPDNYVIYSDVASNVELANDEVRKSATAQLFRSIEHVYASTILPWKYGTETKPPHSVPPPPMLHPSGIKTRFHNVGVYLEGDRIRPGIREDVLERFWAQQAYETTRITITPEMLDTLKAKIQSKGGIGPRSLVRAIKRYDTKHDKVPTGLDVGRIRSFLKQVVRTVEQQQWHRLNEVLDDLPLREARIPVTSEMRETLQERILSKGGYGEGFTWGKTTLTRAVSDYESKNSKTPTGLVWQTVDGIFTGERKSVRPSEWQRVSDTVDVLPDTDLRPRIKITAGMLADLEAKIYTKGGLGSHRLGKAVVEYEARNNQTSVGLAGFIIQAITGGTYKSAYEDQWKRLHEAIDSLPEADVKPRVPLIPPMIADFKKRIAAKGIEIPFLCQAVDEYEIQHQRPQSGLTPSTIRFWLSDRAQSADQMQWELVNEILNGFPDVELRPRTQLTRDMVSEVKARIFSKGNFGARRLYQVIEDYEKEHGLTSTGITASTIDNLKGETLQSMDAAQLDRLNLVVNALGEAPPYLRAIPNYGAGPRIVLTSEMIEKLNGKITAKGDLGNLRLMNAVRAYEKERNLENTGLDEGGILRITYGVLKTVDQPQWERLNEVVDDLPEAKVRRRILLTRQIIDDLNAAIMDKGGFGNNRLMKAVTAYEIEQDLEATGLTPHMIIMLTQGKLKTFDLIQLERLQATIDHLPQAEVQRRTDLTPTMVAGLKAKLLAKGGISKTRLLKAIQKYEADHELPSTGLNESIFSNIFWGYKTIGAAQWQRIDEVLEGLPNIEVRDRIAITPAMYDEMERKLATKGGLGYNLLKKATDAYEAERQLLSTGLNVGNLQDYIERKNNATDRLKWIRFNEVLDSLPEAATKPRMSVTPEMVSQFNAKLDAKGGLTEAPLVRLVEAYEAEHGLLGTGLSTGVIKGLKRGRNATVFLDQWQRMNLVLDGLPDAEARQRITLTPEMIQELNAKIAARGDFGKLRLIHAVDAYEKKHRLQSIGLTDGLIEGLTTGDSKSVDVKHWERLNVAVDSLPLKETHPKIPITAEMLAELKDKIVRKGGFGNLRLMHAIRHYEKEHELAETGLKGSDIQDVTDGNRKSLESDEWNRLNEALNAMPEQAKKERIPLSPTMVSDLRDKILAKERLDPERLLSIVRDYEVEHRIQPVDLKASAIECLVDGRLKSFEITGWERLNAAVDEYSPPQRPPTPSKQFHRQPAK